MLSHVQLFATHGLQPAKLFCPWDSPGKNAGVSCHSLFQGIFLTQGLNPGSPALKADSLLSEHQESLQSSTHLSKRLLLSTRNT